MRWTEIEEATMDKPWPRHAVASINDIAQERYERLKGNFSRLGSVRDAQGTTFDVEGVMDDMPRFYAVLDGQVAGYLVLNNLKTAPEMAEVDMAFILPKFQRRGLGAALYRFVLSKGITIVCDETLTKGSRSIWEAMVRDPKIEVTLIDYDRYSGDAPTERPLADVKQAFRSKSFRMVARLR